MHIRSERRDQQARPFLLTILFVLLLLFLSGNWFDTLDLRWMDTTLRWRAKAGLSAPLADEILIVEMDNEDLHEFGSNGEYAAAAETIRRLASLNVSAIVLDVLYSRGSSEQQQLIRDAIEEVSRNDGVSIILPAIIYRDGSRPGIQKSLPLTEGTPASHGVINMEIDRDRIWRRYSLTQTLGDETHPSLALAGYATRFPPGIGIEPGDEPGVLTWSELGKDFMTITSRKVDSTPHLLNIPHSYFSDEIDKANGRGRRVWNLRDFRAVAPGEGNQLGSPFQGAIVFFGYGTGLDEKATCMGGQEPGVFLHAVALSNLIRDNFLRRASRWHEVVTLLVLGGILFLYFRFADNKLRLFSGMIVGLLLIFATSVFFIWELRIVPSVAGPAFFWCTLIITRLGRLHTEELVERVRLDTTIGYYFSPNVLKHVRENPGSTEPREAELTLLLSDVRHFTRLCQTLPAREMFELLGDVFEIESDAAMKHDGSLQHFWGDQFVAYWGAPEAQTDAADRALAAAREILSRLETFRANRLTDTQSDFGIGIGLHRGEGLVGNMGSGSYLDYTVFGDAVNTTARIESLTKHYGVQLLASYEFFRELTSPPPARMIDRVIPVGIVDGPVELWEISVGPVSPSWESSRSRFEEAKAIYTEGNFKAAAELFSRIATEFDDPPSRTLAQRCHDLSQSNPEAWDGTYRFQHK